MEQIKVETERIDDVPLLLNVQSQMGIGVVINEVIKPHANRKGMSVGGLVMVWLSYILSQSDHRMNKVEQWVEKQIHTLEAIMPDEIGVKDFTDDRLSDVLEMLSNESKWQEIETQLGQRLIRVYNLEGLVRLDTTSVAVYKKEDEVFFRHGESKDKRPDLAQFKVMLATLDPLGMPLVTATVGGNKADDPLYIPTIERVSKIIGRGAKLYVADAKLSSIGNRAHIAKMKDYYLCPLASVGNNAEVLKSIVASLDKTNQETIEIERQQKDKINILVSEIKREQKVEIETKVHNWQERVLAVYSPELAWQKNQSLIKRLEKAEKELLALTPEIGKGHKQFYELCPLETKAQNIVQKYKVENLLELKFQPIHKNAQSTNEDTAKIKSKEKRVPLKLELKRKEQAIYQERELMGWRSYVTNAASEVLSAQQAVLAYRDSFLMEHNFSRLKGRPLGLRPTFIQRPDHARGLVNLLSLALRVLSFTEFVVRNSLADRGLALSGLYSGNPTRQTKSPSTELILQAFRGISLSIVSLPNQLLYYISPLSDLQKLILSLLNLPFSIYQDIPNSISSFAPL